MMGYSLLLRQGDRNVELPEQGVWAVCDHSDGRVTLFPPAVIDRAWFAPSRAAFPLALTVKLATTFDVANLTSRYGNREARRILPS